MSIMHAIEKAVVKIARKRLSLEVYNKFDGIVHYGAFKGLSLVKDTNYSQSSLGAKVTGIYEQSLIIEILKLGPFEDVVDFGASDGYYPLGLMKASIAKRAFCFEAEKLGRKTIENNAKNNNFLDQVFIEGIADNNTVNCLFELGYEPKHSLVICDIEGAEYELFTSQFFSVLSEATIVIELHDQVLGRGNTIRDDLKRRLPPKRQCWIHQSLPVDWTGIPEIENRPGNERALLCSEGRRGRGEWLIVLPHNP